MECSSPSPLDYFAALVRDDDSLSLTEAAGAIALADHPALDLAALQTELDQLAQRLRQRLPADAGALQRVRGLHQFFYRDLGFGGNVNDLRDADNSHLHAVLQRRRGLPIALAVLYLELAGQLGLQADGISFPGHFLIKLHLPLGDAVIDPVDGRSLTRAELEQRLEPYLSHEMRIDLEAGMGLGELLSDYLQPASAREILARMLRNLARLHREDGDLPRLLQVQHRQIVLEPLDWTLRRERGQALAALGQTALAIEDLALYLQHAGAAPDRARVSAQLAALRDAGPPRWH
jgi:regulator of sirC expression with transglutaminase-like and TPR domain